MSDVPTTHRSKRAALSRALRKCLPLVTAVTAAALVAGAVGQVVRDRSVLLALMMYVPLPAVGTWAVLYDLGRRGRSVPGARFSLAAAGFLASAASGVA